MPTSYAATVAIVRVITNTAALGLGGAAMNPASGVAFGAVGLALGVVHAVAVVVTKSYGNDARGVWLLIVDHTWSLPNTILGSLFLTLNLVLGNRPDKTQSESRSTVVLRDGLFPGFATTIGNVEAGTSKHTANHEYMHVVQARIFGPTYVPLVMVNYVLATVLPYWLLYHDHQSKPIRSFKDYFMCGVYPHTWHEEWAYAV
ncbi:MAG: glycine zipper family protein [Actinobacteria bacterium]|nr:glycine zipper family protein [Actinomycetota bacterium]